MNAKKKQRGSKRPSAVKPVNNPENNDQLVDQVTGLLEPLCMAEGLELVHVEYQYESRGNILRIYLDKAGGITLDNCVNISHQMNDLLDVHLETREAFLLEVSSPGSNRPVGRLSDFQKFKGQSARIRTSRPIDGQKNFKGILMGLSGETVMLLANDKTINIPYGDIARARLENYNGES